MTKLMDVPKAADLLGVRSRISWGAIAAGAMIALSIYVALSLLGIALGIEATARGTTTHLGAGAAIYSILTLLLAMFFGGWTTSRLAVGESKLEAVLYGLILWGTLFAGMVWLLSAGIRTGFTAMIGIASGTDSTSGGADAGSPSSVGLAQAVRQRYAAELGSDQFVEDLKKTGLSDGQARKTQEAIQGRIDRLHHDPSSPPEVMRDVASKAELERAAGQATERAREASWWTLIVTDQDTHLLPTFC